MVQSNRKLATKQSKFNIVGPLLITIPRLNDTRPNSLLKDKGTLAVTKKLVERPSDGKQFSLFQTSMGSLKIKGASHKRDRTGLRDHSPSCSL